MRSSVWLLPLLLLAACASKSDVPILRSAADYNDAISRAKNLALEPLKKAQSGAELSDDERDALSQAYKIEKACFEYSPNEYAHVLAMAEVARALDENEQAVDHYDAALNLIPPDSIAQQDLVAGVKAHQEIGLVLLEMGEWEHAVEHLREAAERDPGNPFNSAVAAYALAKHERVSVAEQYADRALAAFEVEAPELVLLRIAQALHLVGEFELSHDIASDAAELHPENPDTHYYEAQALVEMGRVDDARSELEKVLDLDPDHALAKGLLALIDSDSQ